MDPEDAAVDTPDVEAEAVAPADAAEPSGSGAETPASAWAPDPSEWAQVMEFVRTQSQPAVEEKPLPTAADFFQPDENGDTVIDLNNLEAFIDARSKANAEALFGEVGPVLDETIRERGEKIVEDRLTKLETEFGTFDHKTAATLAQGLLADTGGDPFNAIRAAAEMTANAEKAVAARAVEEYKKTIGAIGDAPNQPGTQGAAVDLVTPRKGLAGYGDVADAWAARHSMAS